MKKMQFLVLILAVLLMGHSASLRAEDVDIYVDNAATNGVPNVLFVMDTGANFSSAAAIPCTAYASGGAPSMGNTAGGVEQCALVDAISALPNGSVNIGILVNNNNNFATDVRLTSDAAYHETCSGTYGGCLVRKFALMDAAGKASLISFIKSWKTSGTNSATEFNVKSGGDRTANMMQEAWAYFNGKVGMSTKDYATSVLGAGCQRNFIIFIGNAFNNSGTPGDGGSESPYDGANAMTSAQVGATAAQKAKITNKITFSPATCNTSSIVAGTSASDWSQNWADEWARLMYQQDGGAVNSEGSQNIITYTIGVVNDASCKPDYPALLQSMALNGGGKYFKTSTSVDVTLALATILNEVQAVNSVFSSASLPVSVNAQGTYLNQIFLGMFRPDATGAPRWMGNLKQYKLIVDSTGQLVLGDQTGSPAISSAGTGFISPNANSYWTYKDTATAPDNAATGGFFALDPKGVPPTGYDAPDGEVVEKGGAAQQMRKLNLMADFTGAQGSSNNPRRMFTYCPTGAADCPRNLADASNEFSTANGLIAANAFGASNMLKINSIVRTGTSATVTTNDNHGLVTGSTVTISGATPNDYNVTQAVTVTGSNTFTVTGFTDYPTTPSTGAYIVAAAGTSPVSVVSIVRSSSSSGSSNSEVATVTTSSAHGYTSTSTVVISGASPASYNFSGTPSSVPNTTQFTFPVAITPPATALNTYQAALSPTAYPAQSVTLSKYANNTIGGSMSTAHGFWVGQVVTIYCASNNNYNTTGAIESLPTATSFTVGNNGLGNPASCTGTVQPDLTAQTVTLSRVGTLSTATATAAGAPANFFGNAIGATRTVNIAKASGSATNESGYEKSNITVTCTTATCTAFTYTVTISPSVTATGTITAALGGATSAPIAAGNITRSGSTATASGVTSGLFVNGQQVVISASGTPLDTEEAYLGSWTIACTSPCTSFTFGPVTQTPATPATGVNMQAYSGSTPPDRNTLIKWIRGADNYGDEKGPGNSITVRPSIHGDVLHSRPVVVNYGDSRGVVVFYGANDGVFRAVNGSRTAAIGSVPAGGELWGLVFPEHYGKFNRLRTNSPELKFPSTTLPTALPKDYFADGPTGSFQKITSAGIVQKAHLYVTMRRGGRFMYGLDVTTPTSPSVTFQIDPTKPGFEELGQTWSMPKLAVLQNRANPVLIFGAGYDPAEDSQPPTPNSMGRGIFVIDAESGALVWSANPSCVTSSTCLNVPGMTHAVPSEIAFGDRDENGRVDRLYFGDLGGNVWKVDVSASSPSSWTVTKLAALGCDSGACPLTTPMTTPRKFFYPPATFPVKAIGLPDAYDVVALASGDREHPLKSTATGSSYNVADRFYMLKDRGTVVGGTATFATITHTPSSMLFNATSSTYTAALSADLTNYGFYMSFATGEKGVNAPAANFGFIFFSTNRPIDRSATCSANLGEAKAYAVSPFSALKASAVLSGGGLPPSPVSGLVTVDTTDAQGNQVTTTRDFCLGCGVRPPDPSPPLNPDNPTCTGSSLENCSARLPCTGNALDNCSANFTIEPNLKRTYWYKK
jgi:type IV pilus assembly protein PilY1